MIQIHKKTIDSFKRKRFNKKETFLYVDLIFKSPASKQSAPLFGSLLETAQRTTMRSANQFNKDFARNDVFITW